MYASAPLNYLKVNNDVVSLNNEYGKTMYNKNNVDRFGVGNVIDKKQLDNNIGYDYDRLI